MKILLDNCTRNSGLIVLRTLARNGHEVIAADNRRLPLGLHSRFVRCFERLPHESAPGFVDALLTLVRRHRPDVVLPTAGAAAVSRERRRFEQETRLLVPPFESYAALNDKKNILDECRKADIPHPLMMDTDNAEVGLADQRLAAIVVKPRQNLGAGAGLSIVAEVERVRAVCQEVERVYGESVISEYIPGPDSNNFALHIVLDRDSNPVCQFAFQKTRLNPLRTGVTAAAVSKHMPKLAELVLPMLRQLNWQGPADVEFKLDSRDQEMKLIEINARFSGAVGFPIACGVDLPELTCRAAMGDTLSARTEHDYAEGIKYWSPMQYARSVVQEFWERPDRRILRSVVDELKGTRVGRPYDFTDLAPSLGKILYQAGEHRRRPPNPR